MASWTRLAHEVSDYAMTIDDYTNDLCSRDYLADAFSSATDALRLVISARVSLQQTNSFAPRRLTTSRAA